MSTSTLIIGHGLSGCVLAMTFYRYNIPFRLTGASHPDEASMVSSGLINPVTGRKYVKSWLIDEYTDAAIDFYTYTESLLGKKYFLPVDIIRFITNEEARLAWEKRLKDPEYHRYVSNKRYEALDRTGKSYGVVTGGYKLDVQHWINDVRKFLATQDLITITDHLITGPNNSYDRTIYATGAVGELASTGLIPNKGEALIVRLPDWHLPGIVKEDVFFVPLGYDDLFWVGSYYEPWSEVSGPTAEGKKMIIQAIKKAYTGSMVIVDHLAGVRPTVIDRRPIIGLYPGKENRYLFNGMGTKGTSLAPYWADKLLAYLEKGEILPEIVSPSRF